MQDELFLDNEHGDYLAGHRCPNKMMTKTCQKTTAFPTGELPPSNDPAVVKKQLKSGK